MNFKTPQNAFKHLQAPPNKNQNPKRLPRAQTTQISKFEMCLRPQPSVAHLGPASRSRRLTKSLVATALQEAGTRGKLQTEDFMFKSPHAKNIPFHSNV